MPARLKCMEISRARAIEMKSNHFCKFCAFLQSEDGMYFTEILKCIFKRCLIEELLTLTSRNV